jgi:hypothetical protein
MDGSQHGNEPLGGQLDGEFGAEKKCIYGEER